MIDAREASGVLSKEVAAEARIRADREHDGVDVITKVFWDMVLPSITPKSHERDRENHED
jgi:hypothetical protein